MNFTKEDIQTIKDALRTTGVKDSEFLEATLPLSKTDGITLLQEGKNKKITIGDFNNQMLSLFRLDFINLTEKYSIEYVSLEEAVSSIPSSLWREGLVITFYNNEKLWKIYQFIGDVNQFTNPTLWKDLFDVSLYVINSYLPDEEDITASLPDDNGNSKISLKDKLYDPTNFSGMGTKIIRKNIIEITLEDGTIKRINYLSPDVFNSENTIYVIKYDFTLTEDITIPANCVLKFDGGSLSGAYTITGTNTGINAGLVKIFNTDIVFTGTWNIAKVYPQWFGAKGDGINNDTKAIVKWLDFPCKIKVISNGIYNVFEIFSEGINGSTIYGYGATLRYSRLDIDSHTDIQRACVLRNVDFKVTSANFDGGNISIYGLTIDGNKDNLIYNGHPTEVTSIATCYGIFFQCLDTLTLVDCTIKNTFMCGVYLNCVNNTYVDRCKLLHISECTNYTPVGNSYNWEGIGQSDAVNTLASGWLYKPCNSVIVTNSYFEDIAGSYCSTVCEKFESYGNTIINNRGYLHELGGTNDRYKSRIIDVHNNFISKLGGAVVSLLEVNIDDDLDCIVNFCNNVVDKYGEADERTIEPIKLLFRITSTILNSSLNRVKCTIDNNTFNSDILVTGAAFENTNLVFNNNKCRLIGAASQTYNIRLIKVANGACIIANNIVEGEKLFIVDASGNIDKVSIINNKINVNGNITTPVSNILYSSLLYIHGFVKEIDVEGNSVKGFRSLIAPMYNDGSEKILISDNTHDGAQAIYTQDNSLFTSEKPYNVCFKRNTLTNGVATNITNIVYIKDSDIYPVNGNFGNTPSFALPNYYLGFKYFCKNIRNKNTGVLGVEIHHAGENIWHDIDGCVVDNTYPTNYRGSFDSKPTLTSDNAGYRYFDTTNWRIIVWNGTGWVDATGTPV